MHLFDKSAIRWLRCLNVDSVDAPPYALMAITDISATGDFEVQRPTADNQTGLLFNGPLTIKAGRQGQAHQAFPSPAAFASGSPVNGQEWGAASGSWYLTSGKAGYSILGGAGGGVVNIQPAPPASSGGGSSSLAYYNNLDTYGVEGSYSTFTATTFTNIPNTAITLPQGTYLVFLNFLGHLETTGNPGYTDLSARVIDSGGHPWISNVVMTQNNYTNAVNVHDYESPFGAAFVTVGVGGTTLTAQASLNSNALVLQADVGPVYLGALKIG